MLSEPLVLFIFLFIFIILFATVFYCIFIYLFGSFFFYLFLVLSLSTRGERPQISLYSCKVTIKIIHSFIHSID